MPARPFRLLALAASLFAAAGVHAQPAGAPSQPEGASGFAPRAALEARREMVATANPHASAAAMAVLARGGGALDAAIAAQMVLTLVEPQSSGIGGGAFLLHRDGRSNAETTYVTLIGWIPRPRKTEAISKNRINWRCPRSTAHHTFSITRPIVR